jgi:beta-lactamase regulating signal transducer with metallopeptidase domain
MQAAPRIDSGIAVIDNTVSAVLPAATPRYSVNPMQVSVFLGAVVWLTGGAVLLLCAAVSYFRLKRRVATAVRAGDGVYETDRIESPFVMGLFRPRIYMPIGLPEAMRVHIIRHELTHIKRRDYIVSIVAFAALAVHWFNPLCWLAYILMQRDMEASCDEAVLRGSDGDIRRAYSTALLRFSAARPRLTLPLAFGEQNVKSRIKNVLKYKKVSVLLISAAVVLAAAVGVGCSISRTEADVSEPNAQQVETPNDETSINEASTNLPDEAATNEPSVNETPVETTATPPSDITFNEPGYYTLTLPADWHGRFGVVSSVFNLTPSFYSKSNMDAGWNGHLFNIASYAIPEWETMKDEFYREPAVKYYELGEAQGRMFLLFLPGDVNWDVNDEALTNEYQDMSSDIEAIAKSFKPIETVETAEEVENQSGINGVVTLAGYVDYDENTLYLDEVEIITVHDVARMAELGLTIERDLPGGYYINHLGTERQEFTLTAETVYTWTDTALNFVANPDGDRVYSTTNQAEFAGYRPMDYYESTERSHQIPLFVTVKDGVVLSVREEFALTI